MRQKGRKPLFLYFLRAPFCNRYRNYSPTNAGTNKKIGQLTVVQSCYLHIVLLPVIIGEQGTPVTNLEQQS